MSELASQIDKVSYVHDDLSTLDRPARIKAVKEHLGFYPQNNKELSRIVTLLGRASHTNSVLAHLDEVYKHQRDAQADAPAALRSIIRSFEEYAGNALNERSYMETFLGFISSANPSRLSGFTTVFPTENWESDGTMRATFTALTRHIETEHFAETEEKDSLAKDNLIDNLAEADRVQRIIETLGPLRISSLERTAQAVDICQEKRFTFWVDKLKASRSHFFSRQAASIALRELELISK